MKKEKPKYMSREWWNEHWRREAIRLFGKKEYKK